VRILVVIPSFTGWMRKELLATMMEYMIDKRYKKTIVFIKGRPLEESLNIGADMCLGNYKENPKIDIAYSDFDDFENGYDFMLVNDDDNVPMDNFLDLCELDKDLLFMPYPIMQQYDINKNPIRWGILCDDPKGKGLQQVEAGASGAMMVARRVLEKLKQPIFKRTYSEEDGHVTRGVDYRFSDDVREAGFEIWCNWDRRATHWNPTELFAMFVGFQNYLTKDK